MKSIYVLKGMKEVQIDLEALQNEKARYNWGEFGSDQCILCGKKLGENPQYFHYLTNGNLTNSTDDNHPQSQGCFPVGSECAKKIEKAFKKAAI